MILIVFLWGFGRLDNHQLAQTVSSLELRRKPHDEADLGVGCKRLFIRLVMPDDLAAAQQPKTIEIAGGYQVQINVISWHTWRHQPVPVP